jgi:SpoVK/Ycf46/Vps4 family AAA+-type ATPase
MSKYKKRDYFKELPPVKLRKITIQPSNANVDNEYIVIKKEVNCIEDLIEIGKMYDPNKTFNIDVKTLNNLILPLTELKNMIGMKSIKEDIIDHILFKIQDFDMYNNMMMHTVIEGPPGTGKTEVAKIIGKIYLAMGILYNNKFIKATRSQLIAGYLGQTAIATQKVIDSARGGVLFIDEVYSLGSYDNKDSFSKECIDVINENLTERKTDFICIIAGYKEDIKKCFFNANKGLERRFPIRFQINNYDASELYSIFKKKVYENNWSIDESIKVDFFEKNYKNFNFFGGDMELLFNSCKRSHSRRVFTLDFETKKILTIKDLQKGFESFLKHKNDDKEDKEDKEIWNSMYI